MGLGAVGLAAIVPSMSFAATSQSSADVDPGTGAADKPSTGVGPAVFLRERLGLEMQPDTRPLDTQLDDILNQLVKLGYGRLFGRWKIVDPAKPDHIIGAMISAQFGTGPLPGAAGGAANTTTSYEAYDLGEPTLAGYVTQKTDEGHVAILKHRHWDALHRFAPIAPKDELKSMLLPARPKRSTTSWEHQQLFEKGVTEYFSDLGEVNIQSVQEWRRLRLKNVHGQPIYEKHNG